MLREHPLRVLRYSTKYLWLLIFPILRGAYHFATREDFLQWLHGTWFDLLILLVILGFGWLVWYFRRFTIENGQIYVQDGLVFTRRRYLPLKNLSAMTLEHPLWMRPIGAAYLSADTASGLLEATDIKLLIRKKDEPLFLAALPHLRQSERHYFRRRGGFWRVLLFSLIFSSGLSGAVYVAMFWFQSGRIARDLIEQFRLTERLSTVSEELSRKLMGIPPAAVSVGVLILSMWMLSFLRNVLRYGGFEMQSDQRMVSIRSGLVTRREFRLVNRKINFVDMRQNLLTKLCSIYSLAVNIPGYGNQQGSIPVCLPILTKRELGETLPMLFPGIRLTHRTMKPAWHSFYGYICMPLYAGIAVIPIMHYARKFLPHLTVLRDYLPQLLGILDFLQLMLFIPILWKLIIQIVAFYTTGMSISEGRICVRYCSWTTFHTVVADTDTIVKVRIHQHIWQRWSGKCHVLLYFQSEVMRRCHLWCMDYQTVLRELHDYLPDSNAPEATDEATNPPPQAYSTSDNPPLL